MHYFDEYFEEETTQKDEISNTNISCPAKDLGLVIATFHTQRESFEKDENMKELTIMASSLDALGWKKVFVDIRKEMPGAVSLPIGTNNCPIQKLKSANKVVESRELAKVVSSNPSRALVSLPLGHNAIVAMSRGPVTLAMNSGGMPVVESLAMHLTNDIASW